MSILRGTINVLNALVFTGGHLSRFIDAFGEGVHKYIEDFIDLPTDDTTGDPDAYTTTVVEVGAGDSTVVLDTTQGGNLLITTAANEDDGVNLQLKGEAFTYATNSVTYYGTRFKVSDATQSDFLLGLCITDTTLLGGMTDGLYGRSVDGSAVFSLVLEKDSTETVTTLATLSDNTFYTYESLYDGRTGTIKAWLSTDTAVGTETTSVTTNLPNDEVLTPSIAYLAGAAGVDTMTVDWVRVFQIS